MDDPVKRLRTFAAASINYATGASHAKIATEALNEHRGESGNG